jgi:hypothetical protein
MPPQGGTIRSMKKYHRGAHGLKVTLQVVGLKTAKAVIFIFRKEVYGIIWN